MKRIFAAIKVVPEEVISALYYSLFSQLKNERIKWVDLNNIHITLKFFGETPEELIPDITQLLKQISNRNTNFLIHFNKIGIFGSSYDPRVIWLGFDKNLKLENLGQEILSKMENLGFIRDRQNFVPHLTLGRIKYIQDKDAFNNAIRKQQQIKIPPRKIQEIHLIESILKPSGPEYISLESFKLK
ncbi:MAG: RNA 2',3'-cyclic phosphodiesterase [Bacteroidales bacterium]|nr:RNA 2',3'-cyclic phosphodiesterase [Bacteroidales bacterium]MCF8405164.1 RNA 2',3'-cyclic phosphodiesterase [Bacteroidales bacterium]